MKDAPATRKDIDDVLDVIRDLTTLMSDKFESLENGQRSLAVRMDNVEARLDSVETTGNRIESKLDPTIERVDDHAVRLAALEHGAA